MKVTLVSENLKNGISISSHGVSSRSQLPILLNILIQAKENSLVVSSTDLEIGIRVNIPAKVDEEGEITVPAKTFFDLLSNVNQEKLELITDGSKMILKGIGIKTSFPTLPASDFPKLYEARGEKMASFKKEDFDKEISRIVFSAATDIGRPALSGVLIKTDENGLTLVATDGYRLSLKSGFAPGSSASEELKMLIPARVIKELIGLKGEKGEVNLFASEENNQVLFEYGETELVGRLIEAEYPDYRKIIPEDMSTSVMFDRSQAQNAVRACSVFARESANIIKLTIHKDKIIFSASASSAGENEVEINAKTTGEENEIAFNSRYLLDFFSSISEDDLVFEMNGPLNSGIFRAGTDKSFLHLIMPIRIQN